MKQKLSTILKITIGTALILGSSSAYALQKCHDQYPMFTGMICYSANSDDSSFAYTFNITSQEGLVTTGESAPPIFSNDITPPIKKATINIGGEVQPMKNGDVTQSLINQCPALNSPTEFDKYAYYVTASIKNNAVTKLVCLQEQDS